MNAFLLRPKNFCPPKVLWHPVLLILNHQELFFFSSKNSSSPRPSQTLQAPRGALKENKRGSISSIENPEIGHANFEE